MPARSVQISIDTELLETIDRQAETRQMGRSAFIRQAVRAYLELKRRQGVDAAYERAYGGGSDDAFTEVEALLGSQAWPEP